MPQHKEYRKLINGMALRGIETIHRRDRGVEWNTQDREENRKWMNGLTLRRMGTIYIGDH